MSCRLLNLNELKTILTSKQTINECISTILKALFYILLNNILKPGVWKYEKKNLNLHSIE